MSQTSMNEIMIHSQPWCEQFNVTATEDKRNYGQLSQVIMTWSPVYTYLNNEELWLSKFLRSLHGQYHLPTCATAYTYIKVQNTLEGQAVTDTPHRPPLALTTATFPDLQVSLSDYWPSQWWQCIQHVSCDDFCMYRSTLTLFYGPCTTNDWPRR